MQYIFYKLYSGIMHRYIKILINGKLQAFSNNFDGMYFTSQILNKKALINIKRKVSVLFLHQDDFANKKLKLNDFDPFVLKIVPPCESQKEHC